MTDIIVQKFGGTSVGTVERIDAVAEIIKGASKSKKIIVVVSAMGGETNRLVTLAKHFDEDPDKREFDALVSTGETVSSALLAMALQSKGIKARSYSASQISIRTTDSYSKAKILDVDAEKILNTIKDNTIPIITGFQGVTAGGDVTTLGRGGSDTTAVAIAAQVGAERCDIYTDVDGIFTTDPKVVPNAKKLDSITMEEMLELASQGAKVMQTRAVEFANKYNVPVRVLSSFNNGSGTLISLKDEGIETTKNDVQYKDLIVNSEIAKVSLVGAGMRSQTGVASRAFKALSENDVNIQIICTSEIKITMVIDEALVDKAVQVLHEEFELEK